MDAMETKSNRLPPMVSLCLLYFLYSIIREENQIVNEQQKLARCARNVFVC